MNSDLIAPHLDFDAIAGRFGLVILLILDTAVTAEKKFVIAPKVIKKKFINNKVLSRQIVYNKIWVREIMDITSFFILVLLASFSNEYSHLYNSKSYVYLTRRRRSFSWWAVLLSPRC